MKKLTRKKYLPLAFLLFFLMITIAYFWPFLKAPALNLIDDGASLKKAREFLSNGNFGNLIETQNGRFRPLYWLYFVLIYIVSNTNPLGLWVGQTIVFALTLFLAWYFIIDEKDRNKPISYLVGISSPILFFIPAISANLFRLGTADVRQMLFVAWFMVWMKKSIEKKANNWFGFLIFLLAIFTKETSILLIPMLFIFLLPLILKDYKKHKNRLCSLLFFSFFSFIFYSLLIAAKEASSYSANLGISLDQIKADLFVSRLVMSEIYYFAFAALSLSGMRLVLFLIKKKVFSSKKENYIFKVLLDFWEKNALLISVLTGFIASLFFVFSWQHKLLRYYYQVYIFLFIYVAIELITSVKLFQKLKKDRHKFLLFVSPFLTLLILYATFFQKTLPNFKKHLSDNTQIKKRWFSGYHNSYSIIKVLLAEDTDKMYTLVDDYEVVFELGLFTNKLNFEKNEIEVFSPNSKVIKINKYLFYSDDIINDFIEDENHKAILIAKNSEKLSLDENLFSREVLINHFYDKDLPRPNWVIWRKK